MKVSRSLAWYCEAAWLIRRFISCSVTSTPLAAPISDSSRPRRTRRSAMRRYSSASLLDLGKRRCRIGLVARLVAQLAEDVLILGLDHRLPAPSKSWRAASWSSSWRFMCVRVRPLSSCRCWPRIRPLQLVEALEPERLGEILVDLGLAGGLHGLDGDREDRRPCPSDSRPDSRPGRSH